MTDLRNAVVDLKDSNIAISCNIIDRADAFQGTLATSAENVQVLRDKQVLTAVRLPVSRCPTRWERSDCRGLFFVCWDQQRVRDAQLARCFAE